MRSPSTDRLQRGELAIKALGAMAVAGAIAIFVFALAGSTIGEGSTRLGIGLMVAGASLVIGGLLGFLFGVPRVEDGDEPSDEGGSGRAARARYRPNTNLEQISDWLAKILVGVGLVQLKELPGLLVTLGAVLGPALGGGPAAEIFGAALVVYFCTGGFLLGFLWTRLYLAGALSAADEETTQLLARSLAALETNIVPAQRESIVRELEDGLAERLGGVRTARQQIRALAKEYERIRAREAHGSARTFRLSTLVAQIRSLARTAEHGLGELRELFLTSDGGRVAALAVLSVMPDANCVDLVIDAVGSPRSAFEQYQALRTAEAMVAELDASARASLASALNEQMTEGKGHFINAENPDRLAIATRLKARL